MSGATGDGASSARCGELWPAVDGEPVGTRRNELGESPSWRWTRWREMLATREFGCEFGCAVAARAMA